MAPAAQQEEVKRCKRGHPRTPDNVSISGNCKTCKDRHDKARYKTDAYRQASRERASEWYYSDDPHIHLLILGKRHREDVSRRERRIARLKAAL